MSQIDQKINQFGQIKDIPSLKTYINGLKTDELINNIKSKFKSPTFIATWNYILQGFDESPEGHKKRYKVVMALLRELENSTDLSNSHMTAIVGRLCMELPKFKTQHLTKLCDSCLECLQVKNTQMSWKDLLPEILNVVVERQHVEVTDEQITGQEYKNNVINSICLMQWMSNTIIPLTSMFIEMPLSKEEHLKVVSKLCQYIEKLTPQEIPSFIYQLLKLCKQNHSKLVFWKLQIYFEARIYVNLPSGESSSENSDLDAIESASSREMIEAEGTVLYHIHAFASLGHESLKDYLNSLRNTLKSPEFILHPFQLTVLFIISTIPHYKDKVSELIRHSISRFYHEEQKRLNSSWFTEIVPCSRKVEDVFSQIINHNTQDRERVLEGLLNFGLVLLGVGAGLGRDLIAEKQWHLGNVVLFKIMKRKRHTVAIVMQNLSYRIMTERSVSQYIECMHLMSKNLTVLMLQNKSLMIELMDSLVQIPANAASQLLKVIIPFVKISPTIRDHFIILLRKALYSRVTETRQMAVIAYLKLLTNLKISNLGSLSQSSFSSSSGHSLLTQISMNKSTQSVSSSFSNEALCLEVLGILRRCLMQQAEVRGQLYEGLFNTICLNPQLGNPVLDLMWFHLNNFYVFDEETIPPIKFNALTITKDTSVVLQEPISKLIFSLGLILKRLKDFDAENSNVVKFESVFDSLCERMAKCELEHFELDDGSDLLDILPESQRKLIVLREAMSVYEALIGYCVNSWTESSENTARTISGLYQGYCRLLHFSKNLTKPKKAEAKKKKEAKSSQNTTKKDSQKTVKRDTPKRQFKMPESVLNLQVLQKILSLLHDTSVDFTTSAQANILKAKRDFHQFIMQATMNLVGCCRSKKLTDEDGSKLIYDYLGDIAAILYEGIIKRMSDFVDFDCVTAVLAADCFQAILRLVFVQFKGHFREFLAKVSSKETGLELVAYLSVFLQTYQNLFELDEEETTQDPEFKKLSLIVINTISLLANQIPSDNNVLARQLMDWLKIFAINNTISTKPVVASFVTLMFDSHIKFKVSLSLFEHIAVRLGDITGVIDEANVENIEEFKLLNELSVHNVFLALNTSVKAILDDIDWIIVRLKAEFSTINFVGDTTERRENHLKIKEKGVCCQLCFLINILTNLSNCTVLPGSLSEAVLKNLAVLFCSLSNLTKYFTLRSSKTGAAFEGARFDSLVRLAGKQLAPVVYKLILYIEESQKSDPGTQAKKSTDSMAMKSKVLKETRLIPKVVYEIEQFSRNVIQLSNKTKIDLARHVGQGTARDFRIKDLREVLDKGENDENETTIESLVLSETDEEGEGSPPSKKSRNQ